MPIAQHNCFVHKQIIAQTPSCLKLSLVVPGDPGWFPDDPGWSLVFYGGGMVTGCLWVSLRAVMGGPYGPW